MNTGPATAYVGLGSNLASDGGSRADLLAEALRELAAHGSVRPISSVYETEPWGVEGDQPAYLNMVAGITCRFNPSELLSALLSIELRMGRVRSERYGPRTIDLDLLLYGNRLVDEPGLQVPHPRMHERAFVLAPLAEIAPDVVHPRLGLTISDLLGRVDVSGVARLR